jgi:hypothetical protein
MDRLLDRQLWDLGVWRLRDLYSRPQDSGARPMKSERNPTTYLTIEDLTQIAARKLEQAAALAPSHEKEELLRSAENFRALAEVKGWLSSELQPAK